MTLKFKYGCNYRRWYRWYLNRLLPPMSGFEPVLEKIQTVAAFRSHGKGNYIFDGAKLVSRLLPIS